MKTCRKNHEYDSEMHKRCPVCQAAHNKNNYAKNAARISAEKKLAKEALKKIAELEARIAELQKEKVR